MASMAGSVPREAERTFERAVRAPSHARIPPVTIPRQVFAVTLVLLAAFASECGVVGPSACTVIGCTGLVVEVTGAPGQTPVTVVVTAPDGSTRSSTCDGHLPTVFPRFHTGQRHHSGVERH